MLEGINTYNSYKKMHDQWCQKPSEDKLESCRSSYLGQSLLKFCHLNKKDKIP